MFHSEISTNMLGLPIYLHPSHAASSKAAVLALADHHRLKHFPCHIPPVAIQYLLVYEMACIRDRHPPVPVTTLISFGHLFH